MIQRILYVEITNLTQELLCTKCVLCSTKSTPGKLSQQKS